MTTEQPEATPPPLTEAQAILLAKKYIGADAIVCSTRTVMPDGEIVMWFMVGHTGDTMSWTESGRGPSWRAAIQAAASERARRRRAYRGQSKGGL